MVEAATVADAEVMVHSGRRGEPPIAAVVIAGLTIQSYGDPLVLPEFLEVLAARVRAEHAAYLAAHPEGDAS